MQRLDLSAKFLGGGVRVEDLERLSLGRAPRVAFAGRSNVGKSSLLNALTGMKVARVSAQPGKTREMNFYSWNKLVLVDLPGYGFAKVQADLKTQWGKEITRWLKSDEYLQLVVLLADGRHGLMDNDLELLGFLKASGLSYVVAFTKMDKWKSANQTREAELALKKVAAHAEVSRYICVSAKAHNGVRALEQALRELVV